MKKTYKPHSKQNKQVNSYRKKTIDPGVDLNIKKDDDNMENIDDYWNMAEYVMDDDKTSNEIKNIPKEAENLVKKKTEKKQQSPKKDKNQIKQEKNQSPKKDKNQYFKKSEDQSSQQNDNKKYFLENLESSVINEVMEISTDGSKLTGDYKETLKKKKSETPKKSNKQNNEETSGEDTLFDIENIRESLSHNVLKKTSTPSNTSGLEVNDEVGSINEISNSITNKSDMTPKKEMKKSTKNKKNSKEEPKENTDKLKKVKGKNKTKTIKKDSTESIVTKASKTKLLETKKKNKKRRSSVNVVYDYKGETLIGKNNKIYGMTKISSLFQGKSKLEPLITKNSLESGILFLKPGASIIDETADVSFTIFCLKGSIEITINDEKFRVGRESCLYIEEGSSYDIIDKSRDGSSIFVTFKAK